MSRPSHSSRLYHPNNIGWGVHIIKFLFKQFSSLPCYVVRLRPIYCPQHPIFSVYSTKWKEKWMWCRGRPKIITHCTYTSETRIEKSGELVYPFLIWIHVLCYQLWCRNCLHSTIILKFAATKILLQSLQETTVARHKIRAATCQGPFHREFTRRHKRKFNLSWEGSFLSGLHNCLSQLLIIK
jgi:hypothetical protein